MAAPFPAVGPHSGVAWQVRGRLGGLPPTRTMVPWIQLGMITNASVSNTGVGWKCSSTSQVASSVNSRWARSIRMPSLRASMKSVCPRRSRKPFPEPANGARCACHGRETRGGPEAAASRRVAAMARRASCRASNNSPVRRGRDLLCRHDTTRQAEVNYCGARRPAAAGRLTRRGPRLWAATPEGRAWGPPPRRHAFGTDSALRVRSRTLPGFHRPPAPRWRPASLRDWTGKQSLFARSISSLTIRLGRRYI